MNLRKITIVDVTLQIPDAFAERLKTAGADLSRRALEALALDEYKLGHLTLTELCELLGLETSADVEGFLQVHGVNAAITPEDDGGRRKLARKAAQDIRRMSKGVRLRGLKIKDLINQGRR